MARPGLVRHRKFDRLAASLEQYSQCGGHIAASGALELLWSTAYETASEYIGDSIDVEHAARWKGPRGALVDALLSAGGHGRCGFIDELPNEPGRYVIHDFWDHAPDYVRKRRVREDQREQTGLTLSQIRSSAGKLGAKARNESVQLSLLDSNRLDTCQDTCPATVRQSAACQVANVSTPAPAPAPAPAPSNTTPTQPTGKNGKLPFKVEDALGAIAETSAGRFKATNPGKAAITIQRLILLYPDIDTWRLVGSWFAEGGEGYRQHIDSRAITEANLHAWVDWARDWDAAGRGPVVRQKPTRRDTRLGVRTDR